MAILVLTYWSYKDALIQTYTLPYVKQMADISKSKVFLVCLEHAHIATTKEQQQEINNELASFNVSVIFFRYHRFGIKQLLSWAWYILRLLGTIFSKRIQYIHGWGASGGSIGYLLSMLTGRKLVLDSYEPHAESMVENGTWRKSSVAFRILSWLEKKQSQRASYFIAAASGMKGYAKKTYDIAIPDERFFVKPACVDLVKFSLQPKDESLIAEYALKDKIVCVYAGKLGGIYLNEEVFDFLAVCYEVWGDSFRFLMLTNATREEVLAQINRVGIPQEIVLQKFVWHADVAKHLALADFALNPVKPVSTKRYCTPIKDGEYWAMGLPVVITPNISDDSAIIQNNNIGYVFQELTKEQYSKSIACIQQLLQEDREQLQLRIRTIAEQYRSFTIAEKIYTAIYQDRR